MATERDVESAGYLQEQGLNIRAQRTNKPLPPRGTIPIVMFEANDWDGTIEPLIQAHCAILAHIDTLLADPRYAHLQGHVAAGHPLDAEPELLAFCGELQAARCERIRIQNALAPFWDDAPAIGFAPVTEQPKTHPLTTLAMQLLVARYTQKAVGEITSQMAEPEQLEILRHFRKTFGIRIGEAWALAIVAEIHRAALEQQNASIRDTNLDDEQLARFAGTDPPANATAHAELVRARSFDAMSTWAVRFDLPSWLDAPLVAYFIGRYGFDRGGGAGRKISRATLLRLLTNPKALAKDIEKSQAAKKAFATNLDAVRRAEPITAHVAKPH